MAAADDRAVRKRRSPGFSRREGSSCATDTLPAIHRLALSGGGKEGGSKELSSSTGVTGKSPNKRGRSFSAPGGGSKPSTGGEEEAAISTTAGSSSIGDSVVAAATAAKDLPYIDSVSSENDVVFAGEVSERTLAGDSDSMPEDEIGDEEEGEEEEDEEQEEEEEEEEDVTAGSRYSVCAEDNQEWPFHAVATAQRTHSERYLDVAVERIPGTYKSAECVRYIYNNGSSNLVAPSLLPDEPTSSVSDESECTQCYSDHPIREFTREARPVTKARSEGGIVMAAGSLPLAGYCAECDELVVMPAPLTPRVHRGDIGSSKGLLLTDDDVDDFELDDEEEEEEAADESKKGKLRNSNGSDVTRTAPEKTMSDANAQVQNATVAIPKPVPSDTSGANKIEWVQRLEGHDPASDSRQGDLEMKVVGDAIVISAARLSGGRQNSNESGASVADRTTSTSVSGSQEGTPSYKPQKLSGTGIRTTSPRTQGGDGVQNGESLIVAGRGSRPRTLEGLQCYTSNSGPRGVSGMVGTRTTSEVAHNCELPCSDTIARNSDLRYREQMNCFPF